MLRTERREMRGEDYRGRKQGGHREGKRRRSRRQKGQGKLREKRATRSTTKIAPWDRGAHGMRQVHMTCQLEGYWWL